MTDWRYRVVVIVPSAAKQSAEAAARIVNASGPDYEGDAFLTPLSATGSAPATHWALYTSATEPMVQAMSAALPSIGGAMYWRHGVDGSLLASNVTEATGQSWGWDESLESAGLKAVVPLTPPGET